MITQIDILLAVRGILLTVQDIPVYLDEVKESFESPCFFLKATSNANRYSKTNNQRRMSVYVTYYAEKGAVTAEELYIIQDSLLSAFFEEFEVLNQDESDVRHLQPFNLAAEIDGDDADIVRFQFDLSYFESVCVKDKNDTTEVMKTLSTNILVTNKGD